MGERRPMRPLRRLIVALTVLLLAPGSAVAFDVPAFTPNVVDPSGYLTASDMRC